MPKLTVKILRRETQAFSRSESEHKERSLFGISDGKAVGTYLEHKFKNHLRIKYVFEEGNSASGIDFPGLLVDVKTTSIIQPQSSCPFKSARQKIYGLGYSLLVFVYEKIDIARSKTTTLNVLHTIFVEANRTADYQTTTGIINILRNDGNQDDLIAFLSDRHLPVSDIEMESLTQEILSNPPQLGFLTISNALQWRLQYSRVIERAGREEGIGLVYRAK